MRWLNLWETPFPQTRIEFSTSDSAILRKSNIHSGQSAFQGTYIPIGPESILNE